MGGSKGTASVTNQLLPSGCDTKTRCHLLQQSSHPSAVFYIHRHQVALVPVITITLISTSQASEEVNNYAPTWPSQRLLQSHTRAIGHMHDAEDASCIVQCVIV